MYTSLGYGRLLLNRFIYGIQIAIILMSARRVELVLTVRARRYRARRGDKVYEYVDHYIHIPKVIVDSNPWIKPGTKVRVIIEPVGESEKS